MIKEILGKLGFISVKKKSRLCKNCGLPLRGLLNSQEIPIHVATESRWCGVGYMCLPIPGKAMWADWSDSARENDFKKSMDLLRDLCPVWMGKLPHVNPIALTVYSDGSFCLEFTGNEYKSYGYNNSNELIAGLRRLGVKFDD